MDCRCCWFISAGRSGKTKTPARGRSQGSGQCGEDLLDAAKREFKEETGFDAAGEFLPLSAIKQRAGKLVHAWAVEGDVDPAKVKSNSFPIEWPPSRGTGSRPGSRSRRVLRSEAGARKDQPGASGSD